MLYPRLINCVNCDSIPALLDDIDCKLTKLAKVEYNNISYSLNQLTPKEVIKDLLNYKRILLYRYCNPDYASVCSITFEQIASRIKVLIHK
jgi:hypothetical protein